MGKKKKYSKRAIRLKTLEWALQDKLNHSPIARANEYFKWIVEGLIPIKH